MASLGSYVASWLSNYPGLIQGDTPEECLAKAFESSGLAKLRIDIADFKDTLKRLGYDVQPRRSFGKAARSYWVLALPDRPIR